MSKERELRKIADKFRTDMDKLGLGVSISMDGGPMVEVVPPPKCDGSKDCRAETHILGCFKSKKEQSA